jgi:hypothetical protein
LSPKRCIRRQTNTGETGGHHGENFLEASREKTTSNIEGIEERGDQNQPGAGAEAEAREGHRQRKKVDQADTTQLQGI